MIIWISGTAALLWEVEYMKTGYHAALYQYTMSRTGRCWLQSMLA
jgi:hypothetical protein